MQPTDTGLLQPAGTGSAAPPTDAPDAERTVLRVTTGSVSPRQLARSIWASRELVSTLARKEFFVRYRRASLGVLWAVGLPLVQAAVLSIVFSHVVRVRTGVSYPVFVFSGMAAWTYFTATVTTASTSIVDNAGLTNKIYFPRAILPLVHVRANLYGLVINIGIALALALGFGVGIHLRVLVLVPATLLLVWLAAAMSLLLAPLHVYLRDIRYFVQAVFTGLLYLTPVFLPLQRYPRPLRDVVIANPATGPTQLFHMAICGSAQQLPVAVTVTVLWAVVLSVLALAVHCSRDRVLADLL